MESGAEGSLEYRAGLGDTRDGQRGWGMWAQRVGLGDTRDGEWGWGTPEQGWEMLETEWDWELLGTEQGWGLHSVPGVCRDRAGLGDTGG